MREIRTAGLACKHIPDEGTAFVKRGPYFIAVGFSQRIKMTRTVGFSLNIEECWAKAHLP
jgi:hypothetical protein